MENDVPSTTNDTQAQAADLHTLRVTVRGRVQNVGFRMFVLEAARALGVSGYVRNEYDGSVSAVAAGTREALDSLLEAVRRGPSNARVDRAEVDRLPGNPQALTGPFEVRY